MSKKILIVIIVLVVMLAAGFLIAQSRFEQVERPTSEDSDNGSDGQVAASVRDRQIRDYLVENYGQADFQGRVYCDYDLFGQEEPSDSVTYYLWALCQEYYFDQASELKKGAQVSGPVILETEIVDGHLIIWSHQFFIDDPEGAYAHFPEDYHQRLGLETERTSRLERSINNRAEVDLLPGMGK
ncbi:MAG TPA: hypothetical protein PKX21_01825 [Candidatus Pacearchaeota archaeon]|nr:hypothetical protein [Candidatus Pacearchaeota archaeon]